MGGDGDIATWLASWRSHGRLVVVIDDASSPPWELSYLTAAAAVIAASCDPTFCSVPSVPKAFSPVRLRDVASTLRSSAWDMPPLVIVGRSLDPQRAAEARWDAEHPHPDRSLSYYDVVAALHRRLVDFVEQAFHATASLPVARRRLRTCPCISCSDTEAVEDWLWEGGGADEADCAAVVRACEHFRASDDSAAGLGRFIKCFHALLDGAYFGRGPHILGPARRSEAVATAGSAAESQRADGRTELTILGQWASGTVPEKVQPVSLLPFEDLLIFGAFRGSRHISKVLLSRRPPESLEKWVSRISADPLVHLAEVVHQLGSREWRMGIKLVGSLIPPDTTMRRHAHFAEVPIGTQATEGGHMVLFPPALNEVPADTLQEWMQWDTLIEDLQPVAPLPRMSVPVGSPMPPTPKRIVRRREQERRLSASRRSAIVQAVRNGDVERVRQLLAQGDATAEQRDWDNPNRVQLIHIAAALCQKRMKFRALGGVAPAQPAPKGMTSEDGHPCRGVEMMQLLLGHGASTLARDLEDFLPLFYAAYAGCVSCVRHLVELGTPINSRDHQGRTPLYWAACGGKVETARYLLDHGADVHVASAIRRTPISKASWADMPDVLAILLEYGADPLVLDGKGRTPLHTSVWGALGGRKGHKIIGGTTAGESLRCMRLLLSYPKGKAALRIPDNDGALPLHIAASTGAARCIPELIAAGAEPEGRTSNLAASPLMCASYRGFSDCVSVG